MTDAGLLAAIFAQARDAIIAAVGALAIARDVTARHQAEWQRRAGDAT